MRTLGRRIIFPRSHDLIRGHVRIKIQTIWLQILYSPSQHCISSAWKFTPSVLTQCPLEKVWHVLIEIPHLLNCCQSLRYLFFITAALRHNLISIKFTLLKYMIQWLFVYSHSCVIITTNNFRTFLSSPKWNLIPIGSHSHFSPVTPALDSHLSISMDLPILDIYICLFI